MEDMAQSLTIDTTSQITVDRYLNHDVQSLIIDFLDKSDILSLTCVSRDFNRLATPALYKAPSFLLRITQVPFQWTKQEDDSEVLWRTQQKFADILKARPDLAKYVLKLEWGTPTFEKWERTVKLRLKRHDRMWMVSDPLEESSLPLLTPPHCAKSTALLINLLSSRLHNLKKIHLEGLALPLNISFPLMMCPPLISVKLRWPTLSLVKSVIHSSINMVELSLMLNFYTDAATRIVEWLAEQPFTSLRVLCLRTTRPTPHEWNMTIFGPWKRLITHCRSSLEAILLGFRYPMPGCALTLERVTPFEVGLVEDLTRMFEDKLYPNLRVLKFEGLARGTTQFSGLEAVVPLLVFEEKFRLIIEKWNPDEEPSF